MKKIIGTILRSRRTKKAKVQLEIAENNKGGHRMEATQLVNLTIEEVKKSNQLVKRIHLCLKI